MANDIIINACSVETRVALMVNGQLVELHLERNKDRGIASNIYKGRVVRVLPGMQAAFVDIGLEKAAFLYVRDVVDDFDELKLDDAKTFFHHDDRQPIEDMLQEGQEILAQVSKEPIGPKGAQITSHISLAGRYLVYLPTATKIGISRRIESEKERANLKKIMEKILPEEHGGFIVRTASDKRKERDMKTDMDYLVRTWEDIQQRKKDARPPSLVHQELPLPMRAVRDLFTDDFDRLIVDNVGLYEELLDFFERFLPQLKPAVHLYDGNEPIFDHYGIELEISKALDRKVWLKSGGYIAIDQTEALTSIDVNTGRYVGQRNFDETILKTNLEAVKEVVYQLRLRNIGGLIIIDFIDMERRSDQEKVFNALDNLLKADKMKTTILKISELGLVEMTRKRMRENLTRTLCEPCPYCEGRGYIKSKYSICYELFRELRKEAKKYQGQDVVVYVHPAVAELLYDTERETVEEMERNYDIKITIKADSNFHQEQYEFAAKL